jgi:hypothetical protein
MRYVSGPKLVSMCAESVAVLQSAFLLPVQETNVFNITQKILEGLP